MGSVWYGESEEAEPTQAGPMSDVEVLVDPHSYQDLSGYTGPSFEGFMAEFMPL